MYYYYVDLLSCRFLLFMQSLYNATSKISDGKTNNDDTNVTTKLPPMHSFCECGS